MQQQWRLRLHAMREGKPGTLGSWVCYARSLAQRLARSFLILAALGCSSTELASTEPTPQILRAGTLEARLSCMSSTVRATESLICDVYLVSGREGGAIAVPRFIRPFRTPNSPPTLVAFEVSTPEGSTPLQMSDEATHGRYESKSLPKEGLLILHPGGIIGWRFDLNGDDWLLPRQPGKYPVRGVFRIDLTEKDEKGEVYEAVREVAGKYMNQLGKIVAHGEWPTNWVEVTVKESGHATVN